MTDETQALVRYHPAISDEMDRLGCPVMVPCCLPFPVGEYVRYEDHERALTAAHAARDAAEQQFTDIQWSRDAAWGIARAWGIEAIRPEMRDRAKADPFVADVIEMADALTAALRERDEARAARRPAPKL